MKRRHDTAAAALLHGTKRNRFDSSLDEESELPSQGSLMVLGERERDINIHWQYLKLLSMLSVAFTYVTFMFFDLFPLVNL